jgi:hypothetical protein
MTSFNIIFHCDLPSYFILSLLRACCMSSFNMTLSFRFPFLLHTLFHIFFFLMHSTYPSHLVHADLITSTSNQDCSLRSFIVITNVTMVWVIENYELNFPVTVTTLSQSVMLSTTQSNYCPYAFITQTSVVELWPTWRYAGCHHCLWDQLFHFTL